MKVTNFLLFHLFYHPILYTSLVFREVNTHFHNLSPIIGKSLVIVLIADLRHGDVGRLLIFQLKDKDTLIRLEHKVYSSIRSGIFGSIMSLAFTHNTISAGGSGAIFGLLGALLYFGMHYRTYLGEAIKRSIIPIIVVNLIIGFFAEGIDLAAHIGGLVGGVLVAMMVGVPDKSKAKDIINGTILTIIYLIFISYLAFWR